MRDSRLENYLYHAAYMGLEGWLEDGAALTTLLIDRWQRRHNVAGGVAEIGVHHGKFFILLALLREEGAPAVAIDVFERQEFNVDNSGRGNRDAFDANVLKYCGSSDDIHVIKEDSLKLAGKSILPVNHNNRDGQKIRIFSVDGSHTAQHTENDIEVAFHNLAIKGLVIVDDFYNADWPGVQEGVHRLLARRADIAAVGYGHNKLYMCRKTDVDFYAEFFTREIMSLLTHFKPVELHGIKASHVKVRDVRKYFDVDFKQMIEFGSFGSFNEGKVELGNGWSLPERTGTWICSNMATATLNFSKAVAMSSGSFRLEIDAFGFVHPARSVRALKVAVEEGPVVAVEAKGSVTIAIELSRAVIKPRLKIIIDAGPPESPSAVANMAEQRLLSARISEFRMRPL